MKNLKLALLILTLFGGLFIGHSQRKVVRVYPKQGTVVTTIVKPKVFVHNKINYHFADGVWYRARGRKFVVVNPPIGVKVRRLPRGNKVVVVNGRKLYKYKGIWYKKSGRNYVIVNV